MNQGVINKIVSMFNPHTGGLEVIETDRENIYQGNAFYVHIEIDTLTAGSTDYYQIQTPSTKGLFVKAASFKADDATMEMVLNKPTSTAPINITTSGTDELGSHNMNNNSTRSAETKAKYNGVVVSTDKGVEWFKLRVNGQTTKFSRGKDTFDLGTGEEFILKPATTYLLRFVNKSTGTDGRNLFSRIRFGEEENV